MTTTILVCAVVVAIVAIVLACMNFGPRRSATRVPARRRSPD